MVLQDMNYELLICLWRGSQGRLSQNYLAGMANIIYRSYVRLIIPLVFYCLLFRTLHATEFHFKLSSCIKWGAIYLDICCISFRSVTGFAKYRQLIEVVSSWNHLKLFFLFFFVFLFCFVFCCENMLAGIHKIAHRYITNSPNFGGSCQCSILLGPFRYRRYYPMRLVYCDTTICSLFI